MPLYNSRLLLSACLLRTAAAEPNVIQSKSIE
jgi:hypothetical protein